MQSCNHLERPAKTEVIISTPPSHSAPKEQCKKLSYLYLAFDTDSIECCGGEVGGETKKWEKYELLYKR